MLFDMLLKLCLGILRKLASATCEGISEIPFSSTSSMKSSVVCLTAPATSCTFGTGSALKVAIAGPQSDARGGADSAAAPVTAVTAVPGSCARLLDHRESDRR